MSMSWTTLLRLAGRVPALPQSVTVPCRGLRSKKQILHERNSKSLGWAKVFQKNKEEAEGTVVTEDEPQQPHPIHIVEQINQLYGRPYWEKDIMVKLGFEPKKRISQVLVKNTPYYNDLLREVKHLVRITPLKFPFGMPQDPKDFENCYINSKGELIVMHSLQPSESESENTSDSDIWKMKKETVERNLRRMKELHQVYQEYHEEEHIWKKNEDGKEYRYNFNKNQTRTMKY